MRVIGDCLSHFGQSLLHLIGCHLQISKFVLDFLALLNQFQPLLLRHLALQQLAMLVSFFPHLLNVKELLTMLLVQGNNSRDVTLEFAVVSINLHAIGILGPSSVVESWLQSDKSVYLLLTGPATNVNAASPSFAANNHHCQSGSAAQGVATLAGDPTGSVHRARNGQAMAPHQLTVEPVWRSHRYWKPEGEGTAARQLLPHLADNPDVAVAAAATA
mmetsp:Transcript_76968/g.152430  ORF Transcript_76968/g.152430 Transcript_76968/m.152430 type:complete len:217 (+) Transcript_76968:1022-1672(+)